MKRKPSTCAPRGAPPWLLAGEDVPPPPHQGEWWQSDEDVLDYARWVGRRVAALAAALQSAMVAAKGKRLEDLLTLHSAWVPWHARWFEYEQQLETAWWAQVNRAIPHPWQSGEWDRCVAAHQELREYVARAKALGVQTESVAEPPKDKSKLAEVLGHAGSAVTTQLVVGVVGLLAAAYLVSKLSFSERVA